EETGVPGEHTGTAQAAFANVAEASDGCDGERRGIEVVHAGSGVAAGIAAEGIDAGDEIRAIRTEAGLRLVFAGLHGESVAGLRGDDARPLPAADRVPHERIAIREFRQIPDI